MTNREDGAERKLTRLYINPLHNFGISYSLCIVINARLEENFGLKISDEYEISNNGYFKVSPRYRSKLSLYFADARIPVPETS